jgi:glycosidase
MNLSALFHRPLDNWCYPLDGDTLHIRLQAAAADLDSATLWTGDPFDWEGRAKPDGSREHRWNCRPAPMAKAGCDGLHDFWEIRHAPPHKRSRYFFVLRKGSQEWLYGERGLRRLDKAGRAALEPGALTGPFYGNAFVFPYINRQDLFDPPAWVGGTVWYQIFPERYANGNPAINPPQALPWQHGPVTNREWYGGDLAGITARLDHIAALGFNGLYLTPIFASPSVHKYNTSDYLRIDPAFGSEDDLRRLVEACHRRGIRIMLDGVFNHSGTAFPPWRDVLEHGEHSAYADWFHVADFDRLARSEGMRDSREAGFASFAFTSSMPKLNTGNQDLRAYLLDIARHYLVDFGIDGWRLDVANEIDHAFWRDFRKTVKQARPDAYIVGEIWHDAMAWLRGDQYDAVMNYRSSSAVSDFVAGKPQTPGGRALAEQLAGIEASYPLPVLRASFNVLDTHDTDRFITRCGGDKELARLGWLLLFLLPGSPCVYYGSEVGLEGGDDPDNRRCMIWDPALQDHALLAFFRRLVHLRVANHDLLNLGERRCLYADGTPGLFAVRVARGPDRLWALVNRAGEAAEADMVGRMLADFPPPDDAIDLFADGASGAGALALPARSFRLLAHGPGFQG